MQKKFLLAFAFFLKVYCSGSYAQILQPGFDKEEYRELMLISARSTASEKYFSDFETPPHFKMVYQSEPLGLDNLWDLWINERKSVAVISLRGTTAKQESWLANFYAAMVPAKGEIQIDSKRLVSYHLASNPRAAVHIGWLISMINLSEEIVPRIEELYSQGTKDFLIMGHSQGGAIAFLLTAHLNHLQNNNQLPADIRFKTYCSAGPKPGNLYFAYEYEAMTQGGWAYNVVNAADWVPETPMSIQTLDDFNNTNPFVHAKDIISKQKFPAKVALRYAFNQLDKPARKAQANYQKYLGNMAAKMVAKNFEGYLAPDYYASNHYVRTGATVVLLPDNAYYEKFPDSDTAVFIHHFHTSYLYLLDKMGSVPPGFDGNKLIYSPSTLSDALAEKSIRPLPVRQYFLHSLTGIVAPSLGSLNDQLSNYGFMKLGEVYFSRGGGFYTVFPRFRLVTLFNYSTYSRDKTEGNLSNAVRGTTVGTSLGFSTISASKWQLIPFAGAVYSWFGARISKSEIDEQTFTGYLSGDSNQQHIAANGFVANVGVNLAVTNVFEGTIGRNIIIGLRPNYFISLGNLRWKNNNVRLENGPDINPQGFQCSLVLGISL